MTTTIVRTGRVRKAAATVTTVAKPSTNGNGTHSTAARTVSVTALLNQAAKSNPAKRADDFEYESDYAAKLVGRWVELKRQRDEADRELDMIRDGLREEVDPWYRELIAKGNYESSVRVPGEKHCLRMTYAHRYLKIGQDTEKHLRNIVGDRYDDLFKACAVLKLRKEVTEDPERLAEVVLKLAECLGDDFGSVFESEQTIVPTRAFTELRYRELSTETNAKLELAGVRQIVSLAEHRGK